VIPVPAHIDELHRQIKIIAKLLILLFDSNVCGMDLHGVSRESVDGNGGDQKSGDSAGTLDGRKVTAIRRNDLKSYLFSLDFSCHSNAIRNYINKLQKYGLPVIVRSLAISDGPKNSAGDTILLTEKVKVSLLLEWLFVLNKKTFQNRKMKNDKDGKIFNGCGARFSADFCGAPHRVRAVAAVRGLARGFWPNGSTHSSRARNGERPGYHMEKSKNGSERRKLDLRSFYGTHHCTRGNGL
jgi:hypothetical protein